MCRNDSVKEVDFDGIEKYLLGKTNLLDLGLSAREVEIVYFCAQKLREASKLAWANGIGEGACLGAMRDRRLVASMIRKAFEGTEVSTIFFCNSEVRKEILDIIRP